MKSLAYHTDIPVRYEVDVLVAGGGPAGCMAAAAAAREGAKTLLVEGTGALGGMATSGLVPGWCGFTDQERFVSMGLADRMRRALYAGRKDVPLDSVKCLGPIHAERLKRIFDDLVTEHGARVLFHTQLAGVVKGTGGKIATALVANKAGLSAVVAKVFVDCTGDADLAAWAGAEWKKGDDDGDMQPVSHCFTLTNIQPAREGARLPDGWQEKLVRDERYPLIRDIYTGTGTPVAPGTHTFNAGHLWNVDATDPESLSQALIDGRRLVEQIRDALAEIMPDRFGEAYILNTAALLGVRETRRILGDYVLTRADYDARRRFDDEIAFNTFFIDIHPSIRNRERELRGEWSWRKEKDDSRYGPGEMLGIPYRCLTPKGLANVLVAGRAISTDREVNSALRVMPPCMTMGEAAGMAAAHAATDHHGDVHAVDVQRLRERMREEGGYLP